MRNRKGCGSGVPPVGARARPRGPCGCARWLAPRSLQLASWACRVDLERLLGAALAQLLSSLTPQPCSRRGPPASLGTGGGGEVPSPRGALPPPGRPPGCKSMLCAGGFAGEAPWGPHTAGRVGLGRGQACAIPVATGSGRAKAWEGMWSQAAQGPTLVSMLCRFCLEILGDLCPRSQNKGHSAAPASRSLAPQGHMRMKPSAHPTHSQEGKLGLRWARWGFQDCNLGPLHFQKLGFF